MKVKNLLIAEQGVDFGKKEARNLQLQNLSSDPSSPVKGQKYFNTTTNKERVFNGTTWDEAGTGGGDVTQAANSAATDKMKISAGANKAIKDYAGADGIVKTVGGVPSPAVAGTDYAAPSHTHTAAQITDLTEAVQDVVGGIVAGGNGLAATYNDGANTFDISVNVDNSSIELNTDALRVKALGITDAMLAGAISNAKLSTNPLLRSNHSGSQLASTISDFLTSVLGSVLTGLGAGSNTPISSANTLLVALANLQNQISTLSNLDGVVLKGALATGVANMPAANAGDMYKITGAPGSIAGTSPIVQAGDTVYCIADATASGNWATVGANWVIQNGNIDDATTTVKGIVKLADNTDVAGGSAAAVLTPSIANANYFLKAYPAITFGDNVATSFNLPIGVLSGGVISTLIGCSVFEGIEQVFPDISISGSSVDISFGIAPTNNQYSVIAWGY